MVVRKSQGKSRESEKNNAVKNKALLVAQEISFAKVLAGNDKKLRDRGLKRLKKWLTYRSRSQNELNDDDFMRIWKGLFYCVWMSDKALIQEELCESISSLVLCFGKPTQAFSFIKAFFLTMALEWNGIDQHRLNKFFMLVRRFLRQCLTYVAQNEWEEQLVEGLDNMLKLSYFPDNTVHLKRTIPGGLILHFTDIFLEEIAKASNGDLPEHALLTLLKRFALYIGICSDRHISEAICKNIFDRLIEQSPEGIEYNEKFTAWKKLGFPGDSLHCMERMDDDTEEGEEYEDEDDQLETLESNSSEHLDPRAGKVDVLLPSISFNAKNVEEMIKGCQFKKFTTTISRNILGRLARKFGRLAKGNYPLGYYRVPTLSEDDRDLETLTMEATESLQELKEQLLRESFVPLKKKGQISNGLDEEQSKDAVNPVFSQHVSENQEINGHTEHKRKAHDEDSENELNSSNNFKIKRVSEDLLTESLKSTPVNLKSKKMRKKEHLNVNSDSVINPGDCQLKHAENNVESGNKSGPVNVGKEVLASAALFKQIKNSEGNSFASSRARRSSDTSMVAKSNFTVTDLLPKNPVIMQKSSKPARRASLPAKLQHEVGSDTCTVPANQSPIDSKLKKLKRKKDLWAEPLLDGETEILITKDMLKAKRRSLDSVEKTHQQADKPDSKSLSVKSVTPGSSSKKVNFVLQKNMAQGTSEYFKTLRENPEIPFDAKKKPSHGVLKSSPYSSPINPFYLRKMKISQGLK